MCNKENKCSKNKKHVSIQIWHDITRWEKEVENTLTLFHYEVLEGKGKISHKMAVEKAEGEYDKYKVIQDKNYVSDFDKLLNETKQIEKN